MTAMTRVVFATDIGSQDAATHWEPWSAIEIGFDRTNEILDLQVNGQNRVLVEIMLINIRGCLPNL